MRPSPSIVSSFACIAVGIVFWSAGCSSSDATTDSPSLDADAAQPGCGRLTTLCAPGGACEGAADCTTSLCRDAVCRETTPADGIKNGTETDVDCGGTSSPACADGKTCGLAADCTSSVCATTCQPPTPTDGVKNGDETGVDCGGTAAPKCKTGDACKADSDCDAVRCDTATNRCAGVSDDDGIKNGDEVDVDCGGPTTSKKCGTGKACTATSDCDKALCNPTLKTCNPPTHDDGITNAGETDVDCGGPDTSKTGVDKAAKCVDGETCNADSDCSDFCNVTAHVCVGGRSCKAGVNGPALNRAAGLATCGIGESDDPNKAHESCCRSLPLPDSSARLDKYEVTAGRFRQFAESVAGKNFRSWVATEIANNTATGKQLAIDIPAGLRNYLPASDDAGDPMNFTMQVGGTVMDSRVPSAVQGCYNDDGAYGHNTYWLSEDDLKKHFAGHPKRRWDQADYDVKSMNCSPYWMYAAFCAWDGGRMPTTAEIQKVWPASQTYPWGAYATTKPAAPADRPVAPAAPSNALIANDYTNTVNQNNNGFLFYHYPDYGNAADTAGYIAAPGRFFRDRTVASAIHPDSLDKKRESWFDVGANLFEMTKVLTSGSSTFCDFNVFDGDVLDTTNCKRQEGGTTVYGTRRGTAVPNVQWVGGSWEGHGIPTGSVVGSTQPASTQYGKTGFRCARALP